MASAKTLELAIRIAGKMDSSLTSAIEGTQSKLGALTKSISTFGTVGLAAMGALATATVTGLAKCADEAETYEANMADVVKNVDGLADANGNIDPAKYAEMSDAILDLSTQIPMTAEELQQLAAAAGQSGKSMDDMIQYDSEGNIQGFLKDVAMMGTAMDVSAEQAGDWGAKWEKTFFGNLDSGAAHEAVMVLADQINYLGNNTATTAAEIASVVNDAAALGQVAGVDVSTTAALADAMLAMGVDSSKAATSIDRIYTNLSLGTSATNAQKAMWEELGFTAEGVAKSMQEDSVTTLNSIFTALGNLPEERQVAALKTLLGQWAIEGGAKLTGNLGAFTDALAMVQDSSLYSGSMEKEFIIKASTSEGLDTMMQNAITALKVDIGEEFLPAKKQLSAAVIDFMNKLRKNMPELEHLAETLAGVLSDGITRLGDALENALPYIQQALDYVANNGPEVASTLGKLAAAFAAMKFLPTGIKTVSTIKNLLLGKGFNSDGTFLTRLIGNGGLFGNGGVAETAQEIWGAAGVDAMQEAVGGKAGFGATLRTAITSFLPTNETLALGSLAGKLGSGATTTLGGAAAGAGAVAGGILGALGIGSGIYDIYKGTQINGKEAKDKYFSGGTKIGMVGTGAAAGAAIGSIVPGLGTAIGALIGAGVGGVGALLAGSDAGKALSDATDEGGVLNVFFMQTIPQRWGEFWDAVGNFFTQTIPAGISAAGQKLSAFFTQTVPQKWGEFWDAVGNFFTQTLPYAIGYAVGAIQIFITQTLPQKFGELVATIGAFFVGIPTWASNIWNNHILPFVTVTIPQFFTDLFNSVGAFFAGIPTWASDIWNNHILPFVSETIPQFFTDLFNSVGEFLTQDLPNIASSIWSSIQGFFAQIPNWIGSVWDSITGSFSAGYGAATGTSTSKTATTAKGGTKVAAHAAGGIFTTPHVGLVAEAGPESIIPLSTGQNGVGLWMQTGQMLGVSGEQAALAAGVPYADSGAVSLAAVDAAQGGSAVELKEVNPGGQQTYITGGDTNSGPVTFAPQITIQGNADRAVMEDVMADMQAKFETWYAQMQRRKARMAY